MSNLPSVTIECEITPAMSKLRAQYGGTIMHIQTWTPVGVFLNKEGAARLRDFCTAFLESLEAER